MSRARHAFASLAAVVLLLRAGAAAGDVSVSAEPQYNDARREFTDPDGVTTSSRHRTIAQQYRLTLGRDFLPALRFNASALLEDINALGSGTAGEADFRTGSLNATLGFGDRFLGGSVAYAHREQQDRSPSAGSALLNDDYSLSLSWTPEAAPVVSLRLGHSESYDRARLSLDQASDQATLSLRHLLTPRLRLTAGLAWASYENRLSDTSSRSLDGSASAGWEDRVFGGRTIATVNYSLGARTAEAVTASADGEIVTQQLPAPGAGLSHIADPTEVPELTSLDPNPGLVDGNTSATANLNLGYGATGTTDSRLREMGAQFPDDRTPVNAVFVYVSPAPTAEVATALAAGWAVYRSDDSFTWSRVTVTGAAVVPPFQNRFEIPIETIQARYVKVVRAPLAAGAVFDPRFQQLFVTELQFGLRARGPDIRGRTSTVQNQLNASARTPIAAVRGLAHDVSAVVRRSDAFGDASAPGVTAWALTNGLSLTRKPWENALLNARLARQDTYDGSRYRGSIGWGASLAFRPLETLSHTAGYSGSLSHGGGEVATQNSFSLHNRAEIYRWLSADASGSYSMSTDSLGATMQTAQVSVTSGATLHPTFRLSGGWRLRQSWGTTAGRGQSIDGSASFSPTEATSLSASVTRIIDGPRPTTIGSVSAGFSPFRGGAIELRLNASRSLDAAAEQVGTVAGAGARWNIRQGWYFDVAYSYSDTDAAIGRSKGRELNAGLVALFF